MLYVAVRVARRAGELVARAFDELDRIRVIQKKDRDYVTDIDRKAESMIVHEILKHYPQHGIVAEEMGSINANAPICWYIDPLDGTNNFVHGYPHLAVSIGVWKEGRPYIGVIHDPLRNETFEAENGKGAFLNRRRLRVSSRQTVREAMFASGLPAFRRELLPRFQRRMEACMRKASAYRRGGSAALDLAYVAAGRLDAYWEEGLMPWDIAAGVVLVQEAGGMATNLEGASVELEKGDILATNALLHREFIKLLRIAQ